MGRAIFGLRRVFLALFLPWVGPALHSFSTTHGQTSKKDLRPFQVFICTSTKLLVPGPLPAWASVEPGAAPLGAPCMAWVPAWLGLSPLL